MEKIIEQLESIPTQLKAFLVASEVKDNLIAEQKVQIESLRTQLKAAQASSLEIWVTAELVAPTLVKWGLHLSSVLEKDIIIQVAHTDIKTGVLTPYTWTIPAGKSSVSGTYSYTNLKSVSFQVNPGEGYQLAKHPDRPATVTLPLAVPAAPVIKVGIDWKGPLVISQGGVYEGAWQSLDSEVPAVEIRTREKVSVLTSHIRGAGYLIKNWYNNSDITIKNTHGYGIEPTAWKDYKKPRRFLILNEFRNLVLENNYLENTAGILVGGKYAGNGTAAETIKIRNNKVKNIDGRIFGGVDIVQFVQFNFRGALAFAEICYNEILNEYGHCHMEDALNFYNTKGVAGNPIKVYGNYVNGAFYLPSIQKPYTGGGIIADSPSLADSSAYIEVFENYLIGLGNYCLGMAGGNNLYYHHNYCVNAGVLPDGRKYSDLGIHTSGIWANDFYKVGNAFSNLYEANTVGIVTGTGRGDGSMITSPVATFKNNVRLPDPVTKATEQLYIRQWQAMMAAKGMQAGVI